MQIVPVSQDEIVQEDEVYDIDILLEVKNWAMQSPKWRLLNVLIHTLNSEQFTYKCANGRTILDHISMLLRLALTPSREAEPDKSRMSAVRTYINNFLFKVFFNRTVEHLSPELTLCYLDIIDQIQLVDFHFEFYKQSKMNHLLMVQQMHIDLVSCKGIKFSKQYLKEY